jgi:hypothetical protein
MNQLYLYVIFLFLISCMRLADVPQSKDLKTNKGTYIHYLKVE